MHPCLSRPCLAARGSAKIPGQFDNVSVAKSPASNFDFFLIRLDRDMWAFCSALWVKGSGKVARECQRSLHACKTPHAILVGFLTFMYLF